MSDGNNNTNKETIDKTAIEEQLKKEVVETKQIEEKSDTYDKEVVKDVEKKGFWGLLHIYSSPNNIVVHLMDITGAETIGMAYGGQMVKADKDKPTPYSAMKCVDKIVEIMKEKGIVGVDVNVRGPGGHNGPAFPGKAAQVAIKQLVRRNVKVGKVTNVTPIPFGGCRSLKSRRKKYMS